MALKTAKNRHISPFFSSFYRAQLTSKGKLQNLNLEFSMWRSVNSSLKARKDMCNGMRSAEEFLLQFFMLYDLFSFCVL